MSHYKPAPPEGGLYRTAVLIAVLAILFLAPQAHAQEWTTAASPCVPDEDSAGSYNLEQARFEFLGAATGQIVARCNITNPRDDAAGPPWGCMSITYDDPDGFFSQYRVRVQLRLVRDTDGASQTVTTFDSNLVADSNPEIHCFSHNFNFVRNAYYLTLILDRVNALENPRIMRVRLFQDQAP
jgi:hypothetical protein